MFYPTKDEVFEIHRRIIDENGGSQGLRDEGLLESALAAAENRSYYEDADLPTCAATYAYHLSQAHAFIDGNKRTAAAVSEIFLVMNNAQLRCSNDDLVEFFLSLAAGGKTRDDAEAFYLRWVED